MTRERRGVLFGIAAYGLWGLFPLFWPLISSAGAVEILSHRVVWSLVLLVGVLTATRRWSAVRAIVADRSSLLRLTAAAVVVAGNWGVYIWGVNSHHVVETSLGYFVNPLVTVLLGVLVLHEPLRPLQWSAVGLGTSAVVVLSVESGRPPWIALALAGSFGTYGFLKKRVNGGAAETLTVEAAVLFLPALGYLWWLRETGAGTFGTGSVSHSLLLASTGVVTAVPLMCFGAAATRVPLTTLGLLQYLTPTMQFLLGVLVRHEPMSAPRLAGFGLVWAALVVLTLDLLHANRRVPAAAV